MDRFLGDAEGASISSGRMTLLSYPSGEGPTGRDLPAGRCGFRFPRVAIWNLVNKPAFEMGFTPLAGVFLPPRKSDDSLRIRRVLGSDTVLRAQG